MGLSHFDRFIFSLGSFVFLASDCFSILKRSSASHLLILSASGSSPSPECARPIVYLISFLKKK
jgi:hypothetical protein